MPLLSSKGESCTHHVPLQRQPPQAITRSHSFYFSALAFTWCPRDYSFIPQLLRHCCYSTCRDTCLWSPCRRRSPFRRRVSSWRGQGWKRSRGSRFLQWWSPRTRYFNWCILEINQTRQFDIQGKLFCDFCIVSTHSKN